ncbi:hypothetical protein DY000_02035029 [Brassica cretica]|uniref:Uncharacterized protein n=1 Tax=Brassica cretica TaxID=69181 RepID=A0ABQ7DMP9_BRACR|nr:hypothetical protein DY000_02035029 [Brassica cretica]
MTSELTQEERLELVESIVELSFSSPTNTTHPLHRPDSFLTHHNQSQVRTQNPSCFSSIYPRYLYGFTLETISSYHNTKTKNSNTESTRTRLSSSRRNHRETRFSIKNIDRSYFNSVLDLYP